MAESATPEQKVIVVDFGAQYGQLIARRVRDLHVYSEIVPCGITAEEVRAIAPAAIILSGGRRRCTRRTRLPSTRRFSPWPFPCSASATGSRPWPWRSAGKWATPEKGALRPAVITRAGESALFDGTPGEQHLCG